MMRLSWMVAIVLGAVPAGAAMAQGLIAPSRTYGGDAYQSPREYRPPAPSSLDKNYGLPTLGREGAELPKPRAPEPPKPDTSDAKADVPAAMQDDRAAGPSAPDFFAGAPEITLPKRRPRTDADFGTETPLYTTSDGSALDTTSDTSVRGDMETTSGDTLARKAGATAAYGAVR